MVLVEGCQIPYFHHLGVSQFFHYSVFKSNIRFIFICRLSYLFLHSNGITLINTSCVWLREFRAFESFPSIHRYSLHILKTMGPNTSHNWETQDTLTWRTERKTLALHLGNLCMPKKNKINYSCIQLFSALKKLLYMCFCHGARQLWFCRTASCFLV